jgi:hypothetical protein
VWGPTDRSDRLLVAKLADVYSVPRTEMTEVAQDLHEDNVVQLHSGGHPSISLVA